MATLLDVRPLRHRDFRLLWIGLFVTRVGTAITFLTLPYQMHQLTGSPFAVGMLGVAQVVPIIVMALVGGALADAMDRRMLVRVTEIGLLLCALGLALNASLDRPGVWVLYVVAALDAGFDAIQRPALEATMPRLVPHDELAAAAALNSFRGSVAFLTGPLIGGVVIASAGVTVAYLVDAATFLVSLATLLVIRAVPPPPDAAAPSLASIAEGIRYARARPELMGTYVIDVVAMFFGLPIALLPAFSERFGDARAFGLLSAAPFAGAMAVNLVSGWTSRVHHHGRAITYAAVVWGFGVVGMGMSGNLWLAFACFAIAGGADMISGIFRMTIWNQTIPDTYRGRLAGIEMISYTGGPLLGNVESGVAAWLVGVRGAIVSGGALCAAGAASVAGALPAFWGYDDRTNASANAERARRQAAG
jgi:MFS family permease